MFQPLKGLEHSKRYLKDKEYRKQGNGIFYGHVTDINKYKNDLERLDAAIIQIRTNEEIIKLIEQECIENGTTLQEILQYTTISQLADDLGYCFIE